MKNKKVKLIGILVCIGLCMCMLSGCESTKENTGNKSEIAKENSENDTTNKEMDEPTDTAGGQQQEPVETKESKDELYEPGILTEDSYENKWFKLRYILPEGDKLATQEQIEEIEKENAPEEVADEDYQRDLPEMIAMGVVGMPQVTLEVSDAELTYMDEQYFLTVMRSSAEELDIGFVFEEAPFEKEIAGQTYQALQGTMGEDGVFVTISFYLRREGKKLIVITLSNPVEMDAEAESLMSGFQAIE